MPIGLYEHNTKSNATIRQLLHWGRICKINGFKKTHPDFVRAEGRKRQGIAMLGNIYGFHKGRKQTQSEITRRVESRRKNGWNKNPAHTSLLHLIARLKIKIPFKDTSIEVKLQNELRRVGLTFRTHESILGQPDIFIEPNICIFADGDYWHRLPGRVIRDEYVTQSLREQGYIVLRFWESEINRTLEKCVIIIKETYAKNTL